MGIRFSIPDFLNTATNVTQATLAGKMAARQETEQRRMQLFQLAQQQEQQAQQRQSEADQLLYQQISPLASTGGKIDLLNKMMADRQKRGAQPPPSYTLLGKDNPLALLWQMQQRGGQMPGAAPTQPGGGGGMRSPFLGGGINPAAAATPATIAPPAPIPNFPQMQRRPSIAPPEMPAAAPSAPTVPGAPGVTPQDLYQQLFGAPQGYAAQQLANTVPVAPAPAQQPGPIPAMPAGERRAPIAPPQLPSEPAAAPGLPPAADLTAATAAPPAAPRRMLHTPYGDIEAGGLSEGQVRDMRKDVDEATKFISQYKSTDADTRRELGRIAQSLQTANVEDEAGYQAAQQALFALGQYRAGGALGVQTANRQTGVTQRETYKEAKKDLTTANPTTAIDLVNQMYDLEGEGAKLGSDNLLPAAMTRYRTQVEAMRAAIDRGDDAEAQRIAGAIQSLYAKGVDPKQAERDLSAILRQINSTTFPNLDEKSQRPTIQRGMQLAERLGLKLDFPAKMVAHLSEYQRGRLVQGRDNLNLRGRMADIAEARLQLSQAHEDRMKAHEKDISKLPQVDREELRQLQREVMDRRHDLEQAQKDMMIFPDEVDLDNPQTDEERQFKFYVDELGGAEGRLSQWWTGHGKSVPVGQQGARPKNTPPVAPPAAPKTKTPLEKGVDAGKRLLGIGGPPAPTVLSNADRLGLIDRLIQRGMSRADATREAAKYAPR